MYVHIFTPTIVFISQQNMIPTQIKRVGWIRTMQPWHIDATPGCIGSWQPQGENKQRNKHVWMLTVNYIPLTIN